MKRSYPVYIVLVSLLLPMFASGCSLEILESTDPAVNNVLQHIFSAVDAHGHGRISIIDKNALGMIFIIAYLATWEFYGDPSLGTAWEEAVDEMRSEPVQTPTAETRSVPAAEANPYYDHYMDGVWYGRSEIYANMKSGNLPMIVTTNTSKDGWSYSSIVFQNINKSIGQEKSDWSVFYTDTYKPSPTANTHFLFTDIGSKILAKIVPGVLKMKMTYTAWVTSGDNYYGYGTAMDPKGVTKILGTTDKFFRAKERGGITGFWSSGFKERVYAGYMLEPAIYHPIVFDIMRDSTGALDMNLYVLLGCQEQIKPTFSGNHLALSYYTPNGYVNGNFDLIGGNQLVGSIWDPLTQTTKYLTLTPAGTAGLPLKVKRAIPNAVNLQNNKALITIKVKGANFAPGAMVYFSNPNVALKSIVYVNAKALTVKISPTRAVKAGTKIGIRVVNPDNRYAEKAGVITAQ